MADRINLNRIRNINFAPNKNMAKTTAALTLLLSTTACNANEIIANCVGGLCAYIIIPAAILYGIYKISGGGYQGRGGGGSSSGPQY